MKKFKLKSSQTHFFEVTLKRLGGLAFSFVLVFTSGMLVMSVMHMSGRKTTENDSPFRRNGEVLSAVETTALKKLSLGDNAKQFSCPASSPIKGILDSFGKKYYFEPNSSEYLYTKPDSCFTSRENAEAQDYISADTNQKQVSNPVQEPSLSQTSETSTDLYTNSSKNIIYEATSENLTETEPSKITPKSDSKTLIGGLTFEQMMQRSNQSKIIVVNLAEQNLKTLDKGQVVLDSKITSGRATFETPLGSRLVVNKAKNVRLKAPSPRFGTYDLPAKYWVGIGNGYGFHDASWRSTFGGDDFAITGSHGCINMPTEAVKSLYDWADTGTEVYII